MQDRVSIYIDGSNFYHKIKSSELGLSNLLKFDFAGLAKLLAHGRKITSKRYYIGAIRAQEGNEKSESLRKDQQRLFWHLSTAMQGYTIRRGRIDKFGDSYHEKGVDVQIAVDLVEGAYEDYFDTAILISSDTDLIPAVKKLKDLGKNLEYIGFAHQPSFGMIKHASSTRLLQKEELEPFEFKGTVEG